MTAALTVPEVMTRHVIWSRRTEDIAMLICASDLVWFSPALVCSASREQALELMRRGWPPGQEARYNPDHVLVSCRMRDFKEGLIFLYENMRLFREVLRVS